MEKGKPFENPEISVRQKTLQTMYTSFIRPILEYADTVWDNCTQTKITEIEKIQTEAMRIVTGATKSCSKLRLLEETGWDKLENRRYKHRLITMYNITHKTSPTYLQNLIPSTVQQASQRTLEQEITFGILDVRQIIIKNHSYQTPFKIGIICLKKLETLIP